MGSALPQAALIPTGLGSAHISSAFITLCTRRGARCWRSTGRIWWGRPTLALVALVALALIAAQLSLCRARTGWCGALHTRAALASFPLQGLPGSRALPGRAGPVRRLADARFCARRRCTRTSWSVLFCNRGAGLSGTRRQGAEPAALIRPKRLQRRQLPRRRDGVRRLPNECRFARDLADTLAVAKIVRPHHGGARQICRAGEHTRRDLVAWNGSAIGSRNVGRRNAGIHPKLAILQHNSSVDDNSIAEKDFALLRRQDDLGDARRDEVTLAHENPKLRSFAVLDDRLIGWQWRPSDMLPTVAPLYPTWPPLRTWYPPPADLVVEDPAAVMIGHQAPFGLLLIRSPVPTIILCVHPVSDGVGPPVACNA